MNIPSEFPHGDSPRLSSDPASFLLSETVDSRGHELVRHGTTAFPVACYHDNLNDGCCPWHWHEELEAGVITEGVPLISIGAQSFRIAPGDGFFVNTGVLHSGQAMPDSEGDGTDYGTCKEGPAPAEFCGKENESLEWRGGIRVRTAPAEFCGKENTGPCGRKAPPCRLHSIVFHDRVVGGSPESVFYQKYILPVRENRSFEGCILNARIPWQAEALARIEAAYQACMGETEDYELIVRNELSELMRLLARNLPVDQTPRSAKAVRDAERIKRMLQFVEEHYGEDIRVADIAQSAAVSESECLRCFRSSIGTTPGRYLRELRIDRAAQLLASGRARPTEAAAACGFQDMSYFDRTFRQFKGCTPGEYKAG